jgi:chromosome segregation ATPase
MAKATRQIAHLEEQLRVVASLSSPNHRMALASSALLLPTSPTAGAASPPSPTSALAASAPHPLSITVAPCEADLPASAEQLIHELRAQLAVAQAVAPFAGRRPSLTLARRDSTAVSTTVLPEQGQVEFTAVTLLQDLLAQLALLRPEVLRCKATIQHLELELEEAARDAADHHTHMEELRNQLAMYERVAFALGSTSSSSSASAPDATVSPKLSSPKHSVPAALSPIGEEVAAMRVERNDFMAQLTVLQREHARTQLAMAEMATTPAQLADSQKLVAQLQVRIATLEEDAVWYQQQLDDTNQRVRALEVDLEAHKGHVTAAEASRMAVHDAKEAVEARLAELRSHHDAKHETVQSLTLELSACEESLRLRTAELEVAQFSLREAEATKAALHTDKLTVLDKFLQLHDAHDAQHQALLAAQAQLAQSVSATASLSADKSMLEAKLHQLAAMHEERHQAFLVVHGQLSELEEHKRQLEDKIELHSSNNAELAADKAMLADLLRQLQQAHDEKHASLAAVAEHASVLETHKRALEQEVENHQILLQAEAAKNQRFQAFMVQDVPRGGTHSTPGDASSGSTPFGDLDLEALQHNLGSAHRFIELLEDQLHLLESDRARQKEAADNTIRELRAQVAVATANAAAAAAAAAATAGPGEEHAALHQRLHAAESEIIALQRKLAAAEMQLVSAMTSPQSPRHKSVSGMVIMPSPGSPDTSALQGEALHEQLENVQAALAAANAAKAQQQALLDAFESERKLQMLLMEEMEDFDRLKTDLDSSTMQLAAAKRRIAGLEEQLLSAYVGLTQMTENCQ